MALRQQLGGPGRRRWQQHAGRRARGVLEALIGPVDPDERLGLVVVRYHVLMRQGPIEAEPVTRVGLEVVLAHAQRDTAPVVRATPEHARAPPTEVRALGARVRLTRHLPTPVDGRVIEPERLLDRTGPSHGGVLGQLKHRGLGDRVVVSPRLEHEHFHAGARQHVRAHAPGRSRAHDDRVVLLLPFSPHAASYPSFLQVPDNLVLGSLTARK